MTGLSTQLLTPSTGIASLEAGREPTPLSRVSRSSSGMSVPMGFKAAKMRRTPQFIREEARRMRNTPQLLRQPSMIDPALLEDTDADKLIAGVARLVYRLIVEGEQSLARGEDRILASTGQQAGKVTTADFNREVYFLEPRGCRRHCRWRRCFFRRREEEDLPQPIFKLLRDCLGAGHFSQDLAIVCAVYIERFVLHSHVRITHQNWEPIVLAALLLGSKMFEDIHPWNVDFVAILRKAAGILVKDSLSIYHLEAQFLRGLNWRASITGEVFAAYFFSLKNADAPPSPAHRHAYNCDSIRRCSSWCGPDSFGERMTQIPEASEEGHLAIFRESSISLGSGSSPRSGCGSSCGQGPGEQRFDTMAASFAPGCAMKSTGSMCMADMLWMDRKNPLIGAFRHAPHAGPPSRHINPRLPSGHEASPVRWCSEEGRKLGTETGDYNRSGRRIPSLPNVFTDWTRTVSA